MRRSLLWITSITTMVGFPVVGAIKVRDVKFDKIGRDEWIRARIELVASDNPLPEPKNRRFLDDIKLHFYLIYGRQSTGFDFYESEVEIVSMEIGKRYHIDFFLPGVVVERDQLSKEPFAYLVEFEISGNDFPFNPSHASSNISLNEAARGSMKSRTESEGSINRGILLPFYFAPPTLTNGESESYPAFRRLDSLR